MPKKSVTQQCVSFYNDAIYICKIFASYKNTNYCTKYSVDMFLNEVKQILNYDYTNENIITMSINQRKVYNAFLELKIKLIEFYLKVISQNQLKIKMYCYDDELLFEEIKIRSINPFYNINVIDGEIVIKHKDQIISHEYFALLNPTYNYCEYIETNINLFSSLMYYTNNLCKHNFMVMPNEVECDCLYIYLLKNRINNKFILKIGYSSEINERNLEKEFSCEIFLIGIFDINHKNNEGILHTDLKKTFIDAYIPYVKKGSNYYNKIKFDTNLNYS